MRRPLRIVLFVGTVSAGRAFGNSPGLLTQNCRDFCPLDELVCPGGLRVYRNPCNNCTFDSCPTICGRKCELKEQGCGNHVFVAADPCNSCEFVKCPASVESVQWPAIALSPRPHCEEYCLPDELVCPDHSRVHRNPCTNCTFDACFGDDACTRNCTQELKDCGHGVLVGPDPCNDCKLVECPGKDDSIPWPKLLISSNCNEFCAPDELVCRDHSRSYRNPCNNCTFDECYMEHHCERKCEEALKDCGHGVFVRPDPCNNCQLMDCPNEDSKSFHHSCPEIALICPNGKSVEPDPENNCKIPNCPACDANCTNFEPLVCNDGHEILPNPCDNCSYSEC